MDDQTPAPAAPPSIDDRIATYWREHGEVLTTPGHPDQPRRNDELTRLYHETSALSRSSA
jgi:hypothetical protein